MKRTNNKHVENTKNQILNTLITLYGNGLARITKDVVLSVENNIEILTWDNHVKGRHNAGNSFTSLNQYISIYETGAYHAILFDGSIIRVYFRFNKNILIGQSLLYWPAPINIPEDEIYELGIREAMNMYLSEITSESEKLRMRSPIRFDFDASNDKPCHPGAHIHIQHAECRMSAKKPICFNTFVKFVFLNFYPKVSMSIFNDLKPLNYSGFTPYDKAIVSI